MTWDEMGRTILLFFWDFIHKDFFSQNLKVQELLMDRNITYDCLNMQQVRYQLSFANAKGPANRLFNPKR